MMMVRGMSLLTRSRPLPGCTAPTMSHFETRIFHFYFSFFIFFYFEERRPNQQNKNYSTLPAICLTPLPPHPPAPPRPSSIQGESAILLALDGWGGGGRQQSTRTAIPISRIYTAILLLPIYILQRTHTHPNTHTHTHSCVLYIYI